MNHHPIITNISKPFLNSEKIYKEDLQEITKKVFLTLNSNGYCVLRNFIYPEDSIDDIKKILFNFLSAVGTLTKHELNNLTDNNLDSVFWDIKFRGKEYSKLNSTTFSEQLGECSLHTDSSFILSPEDYLVMYVVKPADKGGESLYLDYNLLLKSLKETEEGRKCISIISLNKYPFQTPKSFDSSQPIIWGKILDDNSSFIRFRYDCIVQGMFFYKNSISEEMFWAFNFLNQAIKNNNKIQEFKASRGDLIFIDNRRGLHARKDFKDIHRHYIRARLITKDQNKQQIK
ncbi:TauD/TfdA family dioxygenase [Acinetobacter baumannii]|uniref:TauD/TfdA family dioxygenase n=1 Tax=Acinetobacter baumannii TaxID=470 RepID=UPI00234135E8|nr:TauD/TfdA family dioxygenase [Acinetobacter baumannii]